MKQVLLAFIVLVLVVAADMAVIKVVAKNNDFTLGNEKNLSLLSKNIKWTPDGHISYITLPNGNKRYFIPGNQRTYTIDAPASLTDAISKNLNLKEVFGPDKNVSYRNFYATIDSVLQTDSKNPNHLIGFAQYEEQAVKRDGNNDYSNFTSSIGLLESFDSGETWKDLGPVIRGDDYLRPGTKITGAGQPCAIIKDGYIYVYFVDWASGGKTSHADEIRLARAKILQNGSLGDFEYSTENGFSGDILSSRPVITIPDVNSGYTSLPSISFNKYLNQYLAIFETNVGFYSATSADGINWNNKKLFLSFAKPLSERQKNDVWVSYPTLLSDDSEKTDGLTQNKGNFYYGKGVWPNTAHELTVKPFEIK